MHTAKTRFFFFVYLIKITTTKRVSIIRGSKSRPLRQDKVKERCFRHFLINFRNFLFSFPPTIRYKRREHFCFRNIPSSPSAKYDESQPKWAVKSKNRSFELQKCSSLLFHWTEVMCFIIIIIFFFNEDHHFAAKKYQ